jgi:hypothetical protein
MLLAARRTVWAIFTPLLVYISRATEIPTEILFGVILVNNFTATNGDIWYKYS